MIAAVVMSFHKDQALHDGFFDQGGGFAGFSNYTHWLLQQCGGVGCPPGTLGSEFWDAVIVTVLFTVVTVVLEVVLGTAMALVMNSDVQGPGPAARQRPGAVGDPHRRHRQAVVLHVRLRRRRQPAAGHAHPVDRAAPGRPGPPSIIGDVWKTTPFVALLILAGLQIIPAELYEAAQVDGAAPGGASREITLPLVRPALLVAVLFRVLDVLRIYDLPAIITQGGGGTGHATTTLSILVIDQIRAGLRRRVRAVDDHVPVHLPGGHAAGEAVRTPTSSGPSSGR